MHNQGKHDTPTYREILRARQKNRHFFRNSIVLVALALFGTAAALAVVKPPELPETFQTQEHLQLPVPFPEPLGTSTAPSSAPFVSETQIRRGDTLAVLLQRLQVHENGLQQFLAHNENARSVYKLYPGRTMQAALDGEGNLVWLRYNHTPSAKDNGISVAKWLEITPDGEGGFIAEEHAKAADVQVRIAEGRIESSLFGATDRAGIPDAITMQMADILASRIDFMRDLRTGDTFRIVYETHSHDGIENGAGRILALEFNNRDKSHEAVWFAPDNGSANYYDFEGRSLRGAFLRTALKFSRISSTFGKRKHPIHGNWRSHNGVDYAAPTGTPIHATADGTIDFVGNQRGYGKTIILKHHGKYSTLYAHQSRFASGLKKGAKVNQGDLIGYVGSTGWATGPHLHYEFRINNKPVDPLSVDLPVASALEGPDREAFNQVVAQYRDHIQLVAQLQEEGTSLVNP